MDAYLDRIDTDISLLDSVPSHSNLSKDERKALKELALDNSLVIKNADKGSGVVVENFDCYIKNGLEHLSDRNIYEQIAEDPTVSLGLAINKFIAHIAKKGVIDNITKQYLTFPVDSLPRTQQLFFLKKIHKNPIAVTPIVSGCSGPTEKISQLIDRHLRPFVPKIKSYIQDTAEFIRFIESLKLPSNCTVPTMDVKSLYLNIPHVESVLAFLKLYYNNRESDEIEIPSEAMKDFLNIVLTKNYFNFAGKMFYQIQGMAMGTKMAPAYANIFMGDLEEKLIEDYHTTLIVWKRYIGDVFCIWPGQPQDFENFVAYLNTKHHSIKFTYEC